MLPGNLEINSSRCFRLGSLLFLLLTWLLVFLPGCLFSFHWYLLGILLHSCFAPICHQIADRCFSWNGFPLPLCNRCIGILAGTTLAWIYFLWKEEIPDNVPRHWILSSLLLLAIDVLAPGLLLYSQSNMTRFLSGFYFGLSFTPYLIEALLGFSRQAIFFNKELLFYEWKQL